MIRAVVFDLDYTLAVPDRDRQTLLDEAVERTGAPNLSRQEYLDAHRRNLTNETREPIFADLLADRESDAAPAALATAYREAVEGALVPIEGSERLIRRLRERYRVGLLTDGPVTAQRGKLETLGWTDLFDVVVVTGTLQAGKPDERAFAAVLDELGASRAEAVYVGDDATADVGGAKDAGWRVVQVLGPGVEGDPRADATVERDALVDRLPDVLAVLE